MVKIAAESLATAMTFARKGRIPTDATHVPFNPRVPANSVPTWFSFSGITGASLLLWSIVEQSANGFVPTRSYSFFDTGRPNLWRITRLAAAGNPFES